MQEITNKSTNPNDYKERFEFRLTVGENIICQRYFRINGFNPKSLHSFELADIVRYCAEIIDLDLKAKTLAYMEIFAPKVFKSIEEMKAYFDNEEHAAEMRTGWGIVVENCETNFVWGKNNKPMPCEKFDTGEFSMPLDDKDCVEYKFAFLVDDREVCSTVWTGIYPRYVRRAIDLSNKRGKLDSESAGQLNFDQYLDYKMVEGRADLIWGIINELCQVCSNSDSSWYTTSDTYGKKKYSNIPDYSLWVDKKGNKR